jgi:hypothetical protein
MEIHKVLADSSLELQMLLTQVVKSRSNFFVGCLRE